MKNRYKHQQEFLNANPSRAMLVWGTGSGKTRAACEWALLRPSHTPLIVCPKGLKENWRRECEAWGVKEKMILSKEEFKKIASTLKNKVVIIDEADAFFSANFKSQLSKSLRAYIKDHNPHLLMLTATPYRSSAWNIYTAAYLLGHRWNYRDFQYRFFSQVQMGFRIISVPRSGTEEELKELIASISNVFNPEDGFDIPEQTDETIYLEETKEHRAAHASNIEIHPIVRFTRDHQIEAGVDIENDPKLELVLRYAIETPKLAVICRYREQLSRYACALKEEGHTVFEMHGDTKNRSEMLDEVENAERCVLLAQSATCEGYEAPSIGVMLFASMDYSYRNYVQMRGRILRMNRLKKNVYVHLLLGDADKAVMKSIEAKEDFDVLAYERTRNNG